MLVPFINSMELAQKTQQVNEILQLNEESSKFGLLLTEVETIQILEERNTYLRNIGRIDIGIEVSKSIILNFCNSAYITPETYADTLHELHEIFYYMKNETEDKISDDVLIKLIKDYFENICGGSIELLKGKLQIFAEAFRKENWHKDLILKEEKD